MSKNFDIAIIGGGIVGLASAWRLAQAGKSVVLIERGRLGDGASGAAAGMLAPFAEATNRGPFSGLGRRSLDLWAQFADELRAVSGLDPELVRTGLLRVAEGGEDETSLRETFQAMSEMGSQANWIEGKALHELEPGLSENVTTGIYSPTEWQVDPRRVMRGLAVAGAIAGLKVRENTEAIGFESTGDKLTGVNTPTGRILADAVLVAGGSWNTSILSRLNASIPVKPIRGQIAALGPCYPQPLRHTIYSHHGYLVPRSSGRVLVGSTEDDAGFDDRPTAAGIADIVARAIVLAPALAEAPFESLWAGLRPLSPDRMPILGKLRNWTNVFVAAGHFRNGILLAPVTAELMTNLIINGEADIDPAFCPRRFETK